MTPISKPGGPALHHLMSPGLSFPGHTRAHQQALAYLSPMSITMSLEATSVPKATSWPCPSHPHCHLCLVTGQHGHPPAATTLPRSPPSRSDVTARCPPGPALRRDPGSAQEAWPVGASCCRLPPGSPRLHLRQPSHRSSLGLTLTLRSLLEPPPATCYATQAPRLSPSLLIIADPNPCHRPR